MIAAIHTLIVSIPQIYHRFLLNIFYSRLWTMTASMFGEFSASSVGPDKNVSFTHGVSKVDNRFSNSSRTKFTDADGSPQFTVSMLTPEVPRNIGIHFAKYRLMSQTWFELFFTRGTSSKIYPLLYCAVMDGLTRYYLSRKCQDYVYVKWEY